MCPIHAVQFFFGVLYNEIHNSSNQIRTSGERHHLLDQNSILLCRVKLAGTLHDIN